MPRLIRGQIASGVAARAVATQETVAHKLAEFRRMALRTPLSSTLPKNLTQLANWSDGTIGVVRVSPNSLRKYLGADGIRGLKRELLNGQGLKSQAATRRLSDKDKQVLADSIVRWSDKYVDLIDRVRSLADTNPAVRRELLQHREIYQEGSNRSNIRVVRDAQ